MEVNINTLSEVLQEAEILVTDTELQPHFDRAYDKERARIEVKGFRKGKAPISMIRKLYGETIEHHALDDIANDLYRTVMDERNIRPIGQPSMINMDYKRGTEFRFKIQYEIRPDITLAGYKNVQVEKPVHHVTDDETEAEILRLRRSNSTLTPVDTVTDQEHIVTGDVQELDPVGTPLIGRKASGMKFYLADESITTEIRQALGNATVGNSYRTRFEPTGTEETNRGAIDVTIAVTKIEKVELPAFDDTFVSTLTKGKSASVQMFRTNLSKDIERYWQEWSERKLADAISSEIVRTHYFPVPDSLVRTLLDSFVEDIKGRSKDRALPKDFDEEKFRTESHPLAVWQAKWMLIKERIAEAEKIEVADDDLDDLAAKDAGRVGIEKNQLLQYYRQSTSVRDRLLTEKIMKFLVQHARISEKIIEQ